MYVPPPLQPYEVRWFYLEPGKFWQPFGGYDSLHLEQCQLELMGWGQEGVFPPGAGQGEEPEGGGSRKEVMVLGDLYEVKVKERVMEPIYWPCESVG